jgi:hypothetical protein
MSDKNIELEAKLFTNYLIKMRANQTTLSLYKEAIGNGKLNKNDQKLLNFILKYPMSIGAIDAALVFYNPYSEIRRRLYIILAILEASPDYYDAFLPKKRNSLYIIFVLYSCVRALIKIPFGLFIIKVAS